MNSSSYNVTIWNRLNSRARDKDFAKTLQAPIRDPLWMLSRQWQFGEFEAEDTGAPVFACAEWNSTKINKISLNGNDESTTISPELPLEAEVERVETQPDFYLRVEMGRHWIRLLKKNLPAATGNQYVSAFRNSADFQFSPIANEDHLAKYQNAYTLNNEPLRRFLDAAIFGKMVDGQLIFNRLNGGEPASSLINVLDSNLDQIGIDFVAWFKRRYSQPESDLKDGWKPERLEYQFATAAPMPNGDKQILASKEYFQGRLDWYNFDKTNESGTDFIPESLGQELDESIVETNGRRHFIPSEIEFPGMPKARWWEFEDRKLNFNAINANLNDTAKMVLTEFAFLYSNDWFMLPFPIKVGSLVDINHIVITDSFGQRVKVDHYNKSQGGMATDPHWSYFKIDNASAESLATQTDTQLFIPPVVLDLLESKPLEEVNFTRDEMANFVWAIETIVPDGLGNGINGTEYALSMKEFYQNLVEEYNLDNSNDDEDPEEDTERVKTDIKYTIATTVPENWIPFIPKHKDDSSFIDIHFQRAAMPRVLPGFQTRRIRPVTRLLRYGLPPDERSHYFINEEEVPRAGAIVRQTWQRTRWHDGRVVLWLGYRKTNGRGEAASGLKFDQANDK